jgi:hypothetical protein
MKWKEHAAWLPAILSTAVAAVATRCGPALAGNATLRRSLMPLMLFHLLAFLAAGVAGLFGALITKATGVQ